MRNKKRIEVKRGDIIIVDLRGAEGSEQKKVRPCLVIQNDVGNKYSPTTIVLPIGHSLKKSLPTHIKIQNGDIISGDKKVDGAVFTEQIRTIDRVRITKRPIARLSSNAMKKVDFAMRTSIGLI